VRKVLTHRKILFYRYSESPGTPYSAVEFRITVGTGNYMFHIITEGSFGSKVSEREASVSLKQVILRKVIENYDN